MKPDRSSLALRRGQSGLSLVELLVAMTIMTIAGGIALLVYDSARRSFKQGENRSEQQQATRIAFDLLTSDIRAAGLNINPDGNKARPDEAIEGAFASAIVIRADFDSAVEPALAGDAFLSVSTGNDEIRAYVLAKSTPSRTGPDTLDFEADVQPLQRDGTVESVPIANVDLSPASPPYTLYRVTLDASGSPTTSTVLIENVRALRFRYFDRAGNELVPMGGSDAQAVKDQRDAIRRIGVEIEGITRDPDPNYVDLEDAGSPTTKFRKFRLQTDITPPNLGRFGIKDSLADNLPPSQPTSAPTLYPGHCGGLIVRWTPNPPEDEVAYYRIQYGINPPGTVDAIRVANGSSYYLGGLDPTAEYAVGIRAVDAAGNASALSPLSLMTLTNTNVPVSPTSPIASGGGSSFNGRIELSWGGVAQNTESTPGDPRPFLLRELAGYRVYRDETPGFLPDPAHRVADETVVGNLPSPGFIDRTAVNCQDYFYRVRAVDACGVRSAPTAEFSGRADSGIVPRIAFDDEAYFEGSGVRFSWSPVTSDINGNAIHIDRYHVYRSAEVAIGATPVYPGGLTYYAEVNGGQTFFYENVTFSPGYTRWYLVKALDACVNVSGPSSIASPTCSFDGRVVIDTPTDYSVVSGTVPIAIRIDGAAPLGNYEQVAIVIKREVSGWPIVLSQTISAPGPTWSYDWQATPANGFTDGNYVIFVTATQRFGAGTCLSRYSRRVVVGSAP